MTKAKKRQGHRTDLESKGNIVADSATKSDDKGRAREKAAQAVLYGLFWGRDLGHIRFELWEGKMKIE